MNYAVLRTLPDFEHGGANIDLFYAWAPLFALLSHALKPTSVFLIFHLLVLVSASWTITLFLAMAHGRRPVWPWLLWILSAAADPIWSGQTASMYLELPFAALSGATIYCIWQGLYGWAAITCLAGWFIKGTAILQALCCAVFALAFGFWPRLRGKGPINFRMALLLISLPVMLYLNGWIALAPYQVTLNFSGAHPAHLSPRGIPLSLRWPPMFLMVVLAGCFLEQNKGAFRNLALSQADQRLMGFLMIWMPVFWGSFEVYTIALPRYLCAILFPQVFLLAYFLRHQPRLSVALAGVILLINLSNQHGRFLPRLSPAYGRSGP